jgi:hypothetical protein
MRVINLNGPNAEFRNVVACEGATTIPNIERKNPILMKILFLRWEG